MKNVAFLVLCCAVMGPVFAEDCTDGSALERYEEVRDNHIPTLDGLGEDEIELIRSAYGAVEAGVVKDLVRRTGSDRYGVNMLMPILGNAGNLSDMTSSDPDLRLQGALGIFNNTAWKFIQPSGLDAMMKNIIDGLTNSTPTSPGVLQDRLNRMHLSATLAGSGCGGELYGLPEYRPNEDMNFPFYSFKNVCDGISGAYGFTSQFELPMDSHSEANYSEPKRLTCNYYGYSEFEAGTVSIEASFYRSVAAAERAFDSERQPAYFGAYPILFSPGVFAQEAVRWEIRGDPSYGDWRTYRNGNLVVEVRMNVVAMYNDVPPRSFPLSLMVGPIASQVFGSIWDGE